ncbi:ferritin-like domain-containing protein [Flaviaesturariibacter amylovorans]|uniref:Ferritin-like domain-containing protein n=1 Tax=Flaviaesturariibacter amylovorans TaxID=1084520 RepID=A0ABP8G3Z5_9BACT
MNLQNIFNDIENVDPEVYDRLDSRRNAMKRFSFIGKTLALAAIPSALGSMLKKAYGQSTGNILDVLNFALKLEYLEAEFYTRGVAASGLIPAGTPAVGALTTIRDHENAHVNFLRTAITAAGGMPIARPNFDFTAGGGSQNGPLGNLTFTNYGVFLAVAQAFEDTGVRAYKGQAGNLMSNDDVLTAALQIHSVEARHAAHIRYMRRAHMSVGAGQVKPWITRNVSHVTSGVAAVDNLVQMVYNGEEVTTQATVNIASNSNLNADRASEAFDEPLTLQQVTAIVTPFFAP